MRVAHLAGPLGLESEHQRVVPASRADWATHRFVTGHANIGDWFVTRTTTEMLDAEVTTVIAPDAPDAAFDLVNANCDLMVLKGGNFLMTGWIERHLPLALLKKIKIPIVYIGAGIQAPVGAAGEIAFTKADVASLKYIHDSCASCMVRGTSTAEALQRIGIGNVRVLGCPTIFWSRKPAIAIKPVALERVGFTLRNNLYTETEAGRRAQFGVISWLRERARELVVLLQGEEAALQAWVQYDRWGGRFRLLDETMPDLKLRRTRRIAIDPAELCHIFAARYADAAPVDLVRWVARHAFFSLDVGAYVAMAKSLDFVVGCRLHGNLVALAHGTPAFFLVHDERVREMVELMAVPHQRLDPDDPEIPLDRLDYRPFEHRYRELYAGYRAFLEENQIRHRLG